MRIETMWNQLPNPIQFIINYVFLWTKGRIDKLNCAELYQKYLEWYEENEKKYLAVLFLERSFHKLVLIEYICKIMKKENTITFLTIPKS